MMKINKRTIQFTILTLFPDLIHNYLSDALISKAIEQKIIHVNVIPLRTFAEGRYKAIDDIPYGGGDGMVFKASILESALSSLKKNEPSKRSQQKIIYLSPQGQKWTSGLAKKMVEEWSNSYHEEEATLINDLEIILICGRYAGIDQRFIQKYIDEEISIGDYVLSGGELAALVLMETISRYLPGVLGDHQSAKNDSFENDFLEAPQFTKPQIWSDLNVPEVLVSGNHQKINEWKKYMSWLITFKKRPDLFFAHFQSSRELTDKVALKKMVQFYQTLTADDQKILQIENLQFDSLRSLTGDFYES